MADNNNKCSRRNWTVPFGIDSSGFECSNGFCWILIDAESTLFAGKKINHLIFIFDGLTSR